MKKVMILAYTKLNLGDDLFIKVLCDRYKNTQFIIYAPSDYKYAFKDIKNLKYYAIDSFIIRTYNYIAKVLKIDTDSGNVIGKSCDAIVSIGGSMFIEWDGWKSQFENHLRKRVIEGKPFYLLGSNFGPYKTEEYIQSYKKLFKTYEDICFREKYSYDLFKELDNVRKADDIIFQLDNKYLDKEENTVSISVIKPSFREKFKDYDLRYYNKIKDIAIYFIRKGMNINLISFCKYEGDEEAIENILKLIPDKYKNNVNKCFYRGNIDDILNILSSSKYIIGTRFHSMILGWVFNKPVFPIVYSDKMTNVMDDVKFGGEYIRLEEIENLDIEKSFENLDHSKIDVNKQIENSKLHFTKLDKFLYMK